MKNSFFVFLAIFLLSFPFMSFSQEDVISPPRHQSRPTVRLPGIVAMVESRCAQDKAFKSFVELMLIVGIGSLFFGTFLTAVMGFRQSILWSFVGIYLFIGAIEFFLILYFRFGSAVYGCLFAFCFAFGCACFVYRHKVRDGGYGHARFHK